MAALAVTVKKTPAYDALQNAVKALGGLSAKIGWFKSAKYEDGTPVAEVAAVQEYGVPSKNIPSRSFMRRTLTENKNNYRSLVQSVAKSILNGKTTPQSGLELIASKVAGDMRKTISQIQEPPLKFDTIKARLDRRKLKLSKNKKARKKTIGSLTKPLIDTGLMYGTLTYHVDKNKKGE